MSELIGGKDALIALANGVEVQCRNNITGSDWANAKCLQVESFFNPTPMWSFRLKPRTITINGIEVPAPFEPKEGEYFWYISDEYATGYSCNTKDSFLGDIRLGAWRTEEEIKQVISALRSVFNTKQSESL